VKFLVDAQLPIRLARLLTEAGHDAVHTSQLPEGNRTTDGEVARLADEQDRIVVSKDRDFRDAHLLRGTPRQLLIVATGNTSNDELLALFARYLEAVVDAVNHVGLVELRRDHLVVHDE
jgi:predicted nuclease of predicted toxin-antitoxin system